MNKYAEDKYAEFERLGERAVQVNLAAGLYFGDDVDLASAWLARKAAERDAALRNEQTRISRSSNTATWIAAFAALAAIIVALWTFIYSSPT